MATSSSSAFERRLNALATKIEDGSCVLVLGPRIAVPAEVDADTPSIDDYLARRLCDDLDGGDDNADSGAATPPGPASLRLTVARYQRLRSEQDCRDLVGQLARELDGHCTALHRDLASLPFRLVLCATFDRMMAQALRQQHKRPQEAHYDYLASADGAAAPRALPAVDAPLVYSLFGRHDAPASMVLNSQNLVDYLVNLTRRSPGLPDAVRAMLSARETVFLFIGFGFAANWWLRLLLKVLEVTGVPNRGQSYALEDPGAFEQAAQAGSSDSSDSKGFFESQGIYLHSGDWCALARTLVQRLEPRLAQRAGAATATLPVPSLKGPGGKPPLVFLSYASEDADTVAALGEALRRHGISVWQDKAQLRAGDDWDERITRVIHGADFFVFVQTEAMDERDRLRRPGVYNRELKLACRKMAELPHGAVYLLHVTVGHTQARGEPELQRVHRQPVDDEAGRQALARAIVLACQGTPAVTDSRGAGA